jgi:hypothetical protein
VTGQPGAQGPALDRLSGLLSRVQTHLAQRIADADPSGMIDRDTFEINSLWFALAEGLLTVRDALTQAHADAMAVTTALAGVQAALDAAIARIDDSRQE